MKSKTTNLAKDKTYKEWIQMLKQKFQSSQTKAAVQVNSVLLEFYWELGREIVEKEKKAEWGSGFLQQMAKDLSVEFSNIRGFSYRNIRYIKQWYLFWQQAVANSEKPIWQQTVAKLVQIPWGHNLVIVSKCKDIDEAIFYVNNTLDHGISRSVLTHQIETDLYKREGSAITNFSNTLPPAQSDLVKEIIKDPYCFDFLTLTRDYQERELENALCHNITKFLLELGVGFAFIGRQYKVNAGDTEFKIDLLFYHVKLKCYVVIELKTVDFKPEFAGKLSFYTSLIDGEIKEETDNQTIGILICKSKNDIVVEYALKDINKPIGVSQYQLTEVLPDNLKSSLPSMEEIEQELGSDYE